MFVHTFFYRSIACTLLSIYRLHKKWWTREHRKENIEIQTLYHYNIHHTPYRIYIFNNRIIWFILLIELDHWGKVTSWKKHWRRGKEKKSRKKNGYMNSRGYVLYCVGFHIKMKSIDWLKCQRFARFLSFTLFHIPFFSTQFLSIVHVFIVTRH